LRAPGAVSAKPLRGGVSHGKRNSAAAQARLSFRPGSGAVRRRFRSGIAATGKCPASRTCGSALRPCHQDHRRPEVSARALAVNLLAAALSRPDVAVGGDIFAGPLAGRQSECLVASRARRAPRGHAILRPDAAALGSHLLASRLRLRERVGNASLSTETAYTDTLAIGPVSRTRCSASSAVHRRAGTVPNAGVCDGPGSATAPRREERHAARHPEHEKQKGRHKCRPS